MEIKVIPALREIHKSIFLFSVLLFSQLCLAQNFSVSTGVKFQDQILEFDHSLIEYRYKASQVFGIEYQKQNDSKASVLAKVQIYNVVHNLDLSNSIFGDSNKKNSYELKIITSNFSVGLKSNLYTSNRWNVYYTLCPTFNLLHTSSQEEFSKNIKTKDYEISKWTLISSENTIVGLTNGVNVDYKINKQFNLGVCIQRHTSILSNLDSRYYKPTLESNFIIRGNQNTYVSRGNIRSHFDYWDTCFKLSFIPKRNT